VRIPQSAIPYIRTAVVLVFVVISIALYGIFYVAAGGRLPLINPEPYQVTFQSPINKNLVEQSEVTLNGVSVGRIQTIEVVGGLAQVTAGFNSRPDTAPLHEGVKAAIKTKTLINETYIDITDGTGPAIPTNTTLPPGNVQPPVDTNEVVRALPAQARTDLGQALQSLAGATKDNQAGISQTIGSLGEPTNYLPAAFKALNDQEPALRQLSANTARVVAALDTRQGQIGELVQNAELVTRTTAGSREDLSNVIRKLSPTLLTAQNASADLSRLGFALQPVAANIERASKPLNEALRELPPTARDLRELLPYLNSTLDKLPPTLKRVPRFASDVRDLAPALQGALKEANPIAAYLKPCANNAVTSFQNLGMGLNRINEGGPMAAVAFILGLDTLPQIPLPTNPTIPVQLLAPSSLDYTVGNSPVQGQMALGNPNSNATCKAPLRPYTK
jgi:phospholipid/cholesterol/gamma-HCH transport system substrate-binding protein